MYADVVLDHKMGADGCEYAKAIEYCMDNRNLTDGIPHDNIPHGRQWLAPLMYLSGYYNIKLHERKSLIIFDEVQMHPRARAAIKYLVADGRFDYIETGSIVSKKRT